MCPDLQPLAQYPNLQPAPLFTRETARAAGLRSAEVQKAKRAKLAAQKQTQEAAELVLKLAATAASAANGRLPLVQAQIAKVNEALQRNMTANARALLMKALNDFLKTEREYLGIAPLRASSAQRRPAQSMEPTADDLAQLRRDARPVQPSTEQPSTADDWSI